MLQSSVPISEPVGFRRPLAAALLAAAIGTGLGAASHAEPFSAEHLVRIDRVGTPVLSPDGSRVVYAVRHADLEADRGRYDLWMSTVAGGEAVRLTTHEANDTSPVFSADGDHVLFLSSRSGSSQVWRLPLAGGEARPVTELPLDVSSFQLAQDDSTLVLALTVFPDCETLACTVERREAQAADPVSAKAYDQLFIRHWDHWLDDRRSQLFALPLENFVPRGEPVPVGTIAADVPSRIWGGAEEYTISPDGGTVYFAARLRDANEPISTNFDLYRAPLHGDGAPERLTADNEAWDTQPVLSPDGGKLAWLAMARPGFEADKFSILVRELATGETRNLSEGWDRSAASIAFTDDGESLLVIAQDVGQRTLWRLPVGEGRGGAPTKIAAGGTVSSVAVAGDTVVFTRSSLASPAELYRTRVAGGDETQLTRFGERTLEGVEFGTYEQFSFAGAGGRTVYGYVVRPVGFDAGRRYPVAFLIHGGPQGSFADSFHYRWNPQTYAGQGLAAVFIDFHGSTGYGQAFTDSISGDWGGKPLEDLRLGLAAALERFPFLDGDRVCALGASYGGYMVNWIAGRWPDRFRCLVNHDGVFDLRAMYYTTEELWFPEWEFGGPYFANPDAYERFNPVRFVENWKTPMLVIHGELDYRVPIGQGIGAFTALQRQGIESRFLYFPDENHWVLKPNNSLRWHEEVNGWLQRHLSE